MFTEDPAVILGTPSSPGEFATAALYDGGSTIMGIFDKRYAEDEFLTARTRGLEITFHCPESSVAAEPEGKTLAINDVNYTITRGEPDGSGWTLLILHRA